MSIDYHRWVQTRLVAHGLIVAVDGLWGPATRAALEVFQRAQGLRVTQSTTPETVTSLRRDPKSGVDTGPANVEVRPVWLAEMERRLGLHEVRDNGVLSRWLKSDGWFLGDPRVLPWCGDAVQTAIALTLPNEPPLAAPGLARNWLRFGKRTQPRLGAIMVFWRGSRQGTSGHVAIYVGEDKTHYQVLGGNQANAITVTRIAKSRFLGARWPSTDTLQTFTVQRAANDPISTNEA